MLKLGGIWYILDLLRVYSVVLREGNLAALEKEYCTLVLELFVGAFNIWSDVETVIDIYNHLNSYKNYKGPVIMSDNNEVILEAIKEFLKANKYNNTLQVLEKEKLKQQSSCTTSLLSALQKGEMLNFFNTWFSGALPIETQEGQVIEFLVRVFFAIFPAHELQTGQRELTSQEKRAFQGSIQEFKEFIETKGPSLSKSEEVLPFYALPYLAEPFNHKAFAEVFTQKWYTQLRNRIMNFLEGTKVDKPFLVHMFETYKGNSSEDYSRNIEILQKELKTLVKENSELAQQLEETQLRWKTQYKELFSVAKSTFKMLQKSRLGESIEDSTIKSAYNELKRLSTASSTSKSSTCKVLPETSFTQLNFAGIIKDLWSVPNDLEVCALLQALRWRLTRVSSYIRKENTLTYIRFNILCTNKPHDQLLDQLLGSTRRVIEYTVRFLNVVASEKEGRNYLLSKENIVELLTKILIGEKDDTILRQNALGVLQKLSLRREAQTQMIELGIIDWIVRLLRHETNIIGDYTLEYSTALLMNLSLRTLGKDKLETNSTEIISLLVKFLDHENPQVLTYINGTLYSILSRNSFKQAARKLNLEKKLKHMKNAVEQNIKNHISFILSQLNSVEQEEVTDESEEENYEREEIESDNEIPEDEDMDDLILDSTVLTGEELLQRYQMPKKESKRTESAREESKSSFRSSRTPSEYSNVFKPRNAIPRTPL